MLPTLVLSLEELLNALLRRPPVTQLLQPRSREPLSTSVLAPTPPLSSLQDLMDALKILLRPSTRLISTMDLLWRLVLWPRLFALNSALPAKQEPTLSLPAQQLNLQLPPQLAKPQPLPSTPLSDFKRLTL
jgi:hypothetical protein